VSILMIAFWLGQRIRPLAVWKGFSSITEMDLPPKQVVLEIESVP